MPNRICPCGHSVPKGERCQCQAKRTKQRQAANDQRRGSRHDRGYTNAWTRASKAYLALHPTCALCGKPSQCVDHRVAHKGDMKLFWDRSNWQPLCIACNSRKAATSEGGFGRKPVKR